jgi:type I restriction enzyme M protein
LPDKGYLGGDRWRSFSLAEVEERDFKLDSFKWLKDESLEDAHELPPPEDLTTDAIGELEGAVEELNAVLALLENGNGGNGTRKELERTGCPQP